jgi:PAS domain S-box-containing protein
MARRAHGMIYANFVPLVFSVGLLVYVYSIHPQGRSNHLFALFMLCTAFSAGALFVTATIADQTLALWIGALRHLIAYTLSDLLFWFLTLELVFRTREKPRWVRIYTPVNTLLSLGTAIISQLDFAGITSLFYGKMGYVPGHGYVATSGPLYIVPQVMRLLFLFGALYVLIFVFLKQDRARQFSVGLVLLSLILLPTISRIVLQIARREFSGLGTLADYMLTLGLGLAVARNLFVPVEIALLQVIDSMTEGLVVLDTAGHILRVNKVAEDLLGVTETQVQYLPYRTLFDQWDIDTETLCALYAALDDAHSITQETQVGHGERHLHVEMQTSPIHTPRGQTLGQMILLTDVTTIRNREENLETALETQSELMAMMTELSSPVLPVLEQVIVLPLVGNLTPERTRLIQGTLLDGIRDFHARIAILDLTGVPEISTEAAEILLRTIDASLLLGTQPILVGIQSLVAELLGDLDFNVGDLVVLADLQAGLSYALAATQHNSLSSSAQMNRTEVRPGL